MYYIFSALINKGYIKDGYFVKMRYDVVTGREWQFVAGDIKGECQEATMSHLGPKLLCWNASLNAVYRTLEVTGSPKLVIWFEGPNWYGKHCLKGYGCVPLPIRPGVHDLRVNVFRPTPTS
jgi:B9 domain-containing protein 2